MMTEPIEEVYFRWLYSKVASVPVQTPSTTFYKLLAELHSFEFVWLVSGDDNRAEDGLDLRNEFLRHKFISQDEYWTNLGCSVLEMFIAFGRRAQFQTEIPTRDWFWIFLVNLGLDELNDAKRGIPRRVGEVLNRLVWRIYDPNGHGGMFPLEQSPNDQRKVEIWYQFCEWVVEQGI